jgi:hypothetical protein
MKKTSFATLICLTQFFISFGQVDTSYIYNNSTPYGTLDLRLAKSATRYYYLQEGSTFSYRETSPGVRTNTYRDMTAWDSGPYTEGNLREKINDVDNFVMNYRLLKPVGYNAGYANGYPLIVLFHGAGERGNCWKSNCYHASGSYSPNVNDPPAPTDSEHQLLNNDHNLLHGGKFYMDAVNLAGNKLPNDPAMPIGAFPGFALFPQNLNGWSGGDAQDVIRIIRLLIKKYNIDPDKIYLSGLSNGGHGALEALKRAPWLFASGIMMSPITDGYITNVGMQDKVAHVPLWVFQGGLDSNPYPAETRNWVKKFRDAGALVRYTEFPDIGHTTWYTAFKEPDFFSWLLDYSTSAVHVFAGANTICDEATGRLLQLPEGFRAYQWQYNGNVISGATGPGYAAKKAGRYRGRFSRVSATPAENEWNDWSPEVVLTVADPPVAAIAQTGTVLLRDLNNQNEAHLQSQDKFAHYYWYKDGALINFPGNQDDTLESITIRPGECTSGNCAGNGDYTLVTANFDNCKSPPSEPRHVMFNDLAPETIDPATQFAGKAESASSVKLTWKDNTGDEAGYEIWRRRQVSTDAYSAWEMPVLTAANVREYVDIKLVPSSVYEYKIRAVGSAARSAYTPAGATDYLRVSTLPDTEPPSPPWNLRTKRTGVDRALLFWGAAADDSGIQEYILSHNGQSLHISDTSVLLSGLDLNETYSISLVAVDLGGNVSTPIETVLFTGVYGLLYGHSPGGWTSLDSIDYSKPEYTGSVERFELAPKTQEDFFYFRFDGYLYIQAAGVYQFRTVSDDGSRLYLNGVRIVNNNGIHNLRTITSATQTLGAGPQRITVDFFEYSGSDSLRVDYKGPDSNNAWTEIPAAALKSSLIVGNEPEAAGRFSVQVFPNPTNGKDLTIQVSSVDNLPVSVVMIDPLGRRVYGQTFDPEDLKDGLPLPYDGKFIDGIYFLRVSQGKDIVQTKVLLHQ